MSEPIEQIAPDLTLRWLHNRQVAFFEIKSLAQASLQAWANKVIALISEWSTEVPLMIIQDFSFDKAMMSSSVQTYVRQFTNHRPVVTVYVCIIAPKSFATQLISLITRAQYRKNRITSMVFTKKDAMAWIEAAMKKHNMPLSEGVSETS
jgi:hypothetical protein